MKKKPNPQGKGTSGVLATLNAHRSQLVALPAKQIDQVATELFTSLFVLEARFRFRPVVGKTYHLYFQSSDPDGEDFFQLCLSPPAMLAASVGGRFIGRCVLQADMTWTLDLDPAVARDETFGAWLADKRAAFEQRLAAAHSVNDLLPVHERRFSFYRRASGFAVAFSLRRSMAAAGIDDLSYDAARGLLENNARQSRSE